MAKLEIIKLTPSAKDRVSEIMRSAPAGSIGIRVSVSKGGCSGYKYEVDYAYDKKLMEESVIINGIEVLICPEALMWIIGATMDYKEDKLSSRFDFINPNETARCGCGESFIV